MTIQNSTFILSQFYLAGRSPGGIGLTDCRGRVQTCDQGLVPSYKINKDGDKSYDNLAFGPIFTFANCNISSRAGISARSFLVEDIHCENAANICALVTRSDVRMFDINFKWSLPNNVIGAKLWWVSEFSGLTIDGDSYDFLITENLYNWTAFYTNHFSEITIRSFNETDYSTNPPVETAYDSDNNSIIQATQEDKKWPGAINESKGGKVYFLPPSSATSTSKDVISSKLNLLSLTKQKDLYDR